MVNLLSFLRAKFKALFFQSRCICILKPQSSRNEESDAVAVHLSHSTGTDEGARWQRCPRRNQGPPARSLHRAMELQALPYLHQHRFLMVLPRDFSSTPLHRSYASRLPTDSFGERIPAAFPSHAWSTGASSIPNDDVQAYQLRFAHSGGSFCLTAGGESEQRDKCKLGHPSYCFPSPHSATPALPAIMCRMHTSSPLSKRDSVRLHGYRHQSFSVN